MPTLTERFHDCCVIDDALSLSIRPGGRADYLALKHHHYRPGNPVTMTRIFAIDDNSPTPADRFLRRAPMPRPIAVLVESFPTLACRLRDIALSGRYAHLPPGPRSVLLNDEMRCISRVIVDPRWRGLGLAVRLVRHALATATTRYTEALAVMGRISPFSERAGMTVYERPTLSVDERALAALRYVGITPQRLAMSEALARGIADLPDDLRAFIECELRRWYRAAGGRGASRDTSLDKVLRAAQQRLLARPVYYLHENKHV